MMTHDLGPPEVERAGPPQEDRTDLNTKDATPPQGRSSSSVGDRGDNNAAVTTERVLPLCELCGHNEVAGATGAAATYCQRCFDGLVAQLPRRRDADSRLESP
jgi:hypothetical protein